MGTIKTKDGRRIYRAVTQPGKLEIVERKSIVPAFGQVKREEK